MDKLFQNIDTGRDVIESEDEVESFYNYESSDDKGVELYNCM